jgi:hypothetical protein
MQMARPPRLFVSKEDLLANVMTRRADPILRFASLHGKKACCLDLMSETTPIRVQCSAQRLIKSHYETGI